MSVAEAVVHLFFDASSFARGAYHQKPSKEKMQSCLFSLLDNATKLFRPKNIFVVWSDGDPSAKRKYAPEYKRDHDADLDAGFGAFVDSYRQAFGHIPVRQLAIPGIEAKDVIGFLWDKLKQKKVVVSNDRDLTQLIDHDTTLYRPVKSEILIPDNADVKLGFPHQHYVLWRSLVGNADAGIAGVKGIGCARAARIINAVSKTGKKLPIRPEELHILDRNKMIFTIGALLSQDDKVEIINAYVKESGKNYSLDGVASALGRSNLISLYPAVIDWAVRHERFVMGRH